MHAVLSRAYLVSARSESFKYLVPIAVRPWTYVLTSIAILQAVKCCNAELHLSHFLNRFAISQ